MKWIAIAGGWRKTNYQIEEDIKKEPVADNIDQKETNVNPDDLPKSG